MSTTPPPRRRFRLPFCWVVTLLVLAVAGAWEACKWNDWHRALVASDAAKAALYQSVAKAIETAYPQAVAAAVRTLA